ncbi:hypothetical protein [Helicobacter pylori]|uniref:hypothetical protein n=1 Tax=Helicobacter pylori TaxID=210 RepID=UPI0018D0F942|nr:hypothetical protein [Helicobacter pylori]
MGHWFGNPSNDTQENPKDAQKSTNFHEKCTKPTETTELTNENTKLKTEKTELNSKITGLSAEKDKLDKEKTELTEKNKNLTTEKERLERESKNLTTEKENLNNQLNASQKQVNELKNSKQVLENEKADLTNENTKLKTENTGLTNKITGLSTDKENLTTDLSTAKNQAEQTSQKLNELEQKHAPYQKLEKLYEVFLEVKDRLNFDFVATTYSAMDLIASVLSDSKYYLESLYNKARQELSDKRSDKGEKLAELFDLLFEYIKDSKFERLKEPSAYDHSCKKLYPEQNTSQKMQRVVLRGYTYDKKIACYTIVDMGS